MVVFSHRGKGFGTKENSLCNFKNAARQGFSVEVDLRINDTKVILSHDKANEDIFEFEGLMGLASEYPDILFALHLKENSEVLINRVTQAVGEKKNCFLFCTDFEQGAFIRKGYREIGREKLALYVTEKVIHPDLIDKVDYLWLDETRQEIYGDLNYFKEFNKKIICCSPELFLNHVDDCKNIFFKKIIEDQDLFGICTDFPNKGGVRL